MVRHVVEREVFLPYLDRGHHLALFLTIYQVVVVLHRNEGRQAIVDGVIYHGRRGGKRGGEQFVSASSVPFLSPRVAGMRYALCI